MQHVGSLKKGLLDPNPFDPSEVTLAGTSENLFHCPPKPNEVTDAGTPLICAAMEGVANNPTANPATVNRISRDIQESYPSCHLMAHLRSLIPADSND